MNTPQFAALAGINVKTVRLAIARGWLDADLKGGKWDIPEAAVAKALGRRTFVRVSQTGLTIHSWHCENLAILSQRTDHFATPAAAADFLRAVWKQNASQDQHPDHPPRTKRQAQPELPLAAPTSDDPPAGQTRTAPALHDAPQAHHDAATPAPALPPAPAPEPQPSPTPAPTSAAARFNRLALF